MVAMLGLTTIPFSRVQPTPERNFMAFFRRSCQDLDPAAKSVVYVFSNTTTHWPMLPTHLVDRSSKK
jgi:hypothetical protein